MCRHLVGTLRLGYDKAPPVSEDSRGHQCHALGVLGLSHLVCLWDNCRVNTPCEFAGCERPGRRHGLCDAHSQQIRRGRPLTPLRAKRAQGASLARDARGYKECRRCGEWLPESSFEPHSRSADRLMVHCRKCKQFYWKARMNHLTPTQLEALVRERGEACGICGVNVIQGAMALAIDHDHKCCPWSGRSCGKCIRGLLCSNCNTGLGSFKDDVTLLSRAAEYLGSAHWSAPTP